MDFRNESWTTIANRALASIGRETLTDVESDEGSDAELVRQSLPEAVGVCAEWFDWSFLREQSLLRPDATPYDASYGFSYTFPAESVRTQGIELESRYEILGGKICTDSPTCRVTYIRLPQEPVQGQPTWNTAVQHYLAFLLAKSLTGSDQIVSQEYQLFEKWIEKAMAHDRSYLRNKGERWWTEEIYG